MHLTAHHRAVSARGAWSGDRLEYRFLIALSFPICLVMALARRLTTGSNPGDQSAFSEARSATHAAIGYAFMSSPSSFVGLRAGETPRSCSSRQATGPRGAAAQATRR